MEHKKHHDLAYNKSELEGFWKMEGYSSILEFKGGKVRRWEYTKVSYLPESPDLIDLSLIPFKIFIEQDDKLYFSFQGESAQKSAVKIANIDEYLHREFQAFINDPIINFVVFWHTFQENFAFFNLYNLNWKDFYHKYRDQISSSSTVKDLEEIFTQMVTPIIDRHTMVHLPDGNVVSGGSYPDWYDFDQAKKIKRQINMELSQEIKPDGRYAWMFFDKFLTVIKSNYLKDQISEKFHRLIFYGKISGDIGYINILRFMNYDNLFEGDLIAKEIDDIIDEMQDMKALIVDIRFNLGGYDRHAFIVANRFADTKRLALTKRAFESGTLSPSMEAYVKPEGYRQYVKPVILLTSRYTCSGAEIFTMAMTTFPHVKSIGNLTAGCHSDTFDRILPNGWHFSLSNEIYLMHGEACYEGVGCPPNLLVDFESEAFKHGKDKILDTAIELLQQRSEKK